MVALEHNHTPPSNTYNTVLCCFLVDLATNMKQYAFLKFTSCTVRRKNRSSISEKMFALKKKALKWTIWWDTDKNTTVQNSLRLFSLSYQVVFQSAGRRRFVPGFCLLRSLYGGCSLAPETFPKHQTKDIFPTRCSLDQHGSCLCEEDVFGVEGGSWAPNSKLFTELNI